MTFCFFENDFFLLYNKLSIRKAEPVSILSVFRCKNIVIKNKNKPKFWNLSLIFYINDLIGGRGL